MGDSREKQERKKRDMKRLLTAITITSKKLMSTQYCGLIMRHKNTEPKNLMELNLILHYLFSYCLLLNRFFLFLVVYLYLALNSIVKIYILIHTNTSNLRLINALLVRKGEALQLSTSLFYTITKSQFCYSWQFSFLLRMARTTQLIYGDVAVYQG